MREVCKVFYSHDMTQLFSLVLNTLLRPSQHILKQTHSRRNNRVQRRAVEMIREMKRLLYEERLKKLALRQVTRKGEHARDRQDNKCLWQVNPILLIVVLISQQKRQHGTGKGIYLQSTKETHFIKDLVFLWKTLPQIDTETQTSIGLEEDYPLMQIIKASIFIVDKKQYISGHKPS